MVHLRCLNNIIMITNCWNTDFNGEEAKINSSLTILKKVSIKYTNQILGWKVFLNKRNIHTDTSSESYFIVNVPVVKFFWFNKIWNLACKGPGTEYHIGRIGYTGMTFPPKIYLWN